MRFNDYLQSITNDSFTDMCFEIAGRKENWARILERCGPDILEEFNNDTIDALKDKWDENHATEEEK